MHEQSWYVYLVRTENSKLYCGVSDDPVIRFYKHCMGKGAKFFFTTKPIALVYIEKCISKSQALSRERAIKQLSKSAKEALIVNESRLFKLPLLYDKDHLMTFEEILLS